MLAAAWRRYRGIEGDGSIDPLPEVHMLMSRSAVSRLLILLLLTVSVSGCDLVAGIFKAGFWAGIIVVALVVVGIVFLVGKVRR
jgi:hypothetical protein